MRLFQACFPGNTLKTDSFKLDTTVTCFAAVYARTQSLGYGFTLLCKCGENSELLFERLG